MKIPPWVAKANEPRDLAVGETLAKPSDIPVDKQGLYCDPHKCGKCGEIYDYCPCNQDIHFLATEYRCEYCEYDYALYVVEHYKEERKLK